MRVLLRPLFAELAVAAVVRGSAIMPSTESTLNARQAVAVNFTLVRNNAVLIATRSWELGVLTDALAEFEQPNITVFNATYPPADNISVPQDVLNIASSIVAAKQNGTLALTSDTAVGDPASIGPAVLLANWTTNDTTYASAAGQQLEYLLDYAPRSDTGAISQRQEQVQLWADFLYMAPPFIALFGALQNSTDLLNQSYVQCSLYRDVLFDADVGLWRHVALGEWQDTNHWATGNGWAAAGMMRVLMTIHQSAAGVELATQESDLVDWVNETLSGVWAYQQASGALLNFLDQDPSATFSDASSTALVAATTFRFMALTGDNTHLNATKLAYSFVQSSIDANGWLWGTADVLTFVNPSAEGVASPEGQSFVLMLQAAYEAWTEAMAQSIADAIQSASGTR